MDDMYDIQEEAKANRNVDTSEMKKHECYKTIWNMRVRYLKADEAFPGERVRNLKAFPGEWILSTWYHCPHTDDEIELSSFIKFCPWCGSELK